jgi:hypothetical protein
MASMMDKTDKRYLPKKELDLYKSIAKHYETKQYKKGTKVQPPRPTLEPITAITAPTLLRSCISNRKGEREKEREIRKEGTFANPVAEVTAWPCRCAIGAGEHTRTLGGGETIGWVAVPAAAASVAH